MVWPIMAVITYLSFINTLTQRKALMSALKLKLQMKVFLPVHKTMYNVVQHYKLFAC